MSSNRRMRDVPAHAVQSSRDENFQFDAKGIWQWWNVIDEGVGARCQCLTTFRYSCDILGSFLVDFFDFFIFGSSQKLHNTKIEHHCRLQHETSLDKGCCTSTQQLEAHFSRWNLPSPFKLSMFILETTSEQLKSVFSVIVTRMDLKIITWWISFFFEQHYAELMLVPKHHESKEKSCSSVVARLVKIPSSSSPPPLPFRNQTTTAKEWAEKENKIFISP